MTQRKSSRTSIYRIFLCSVFSILSSILLVTGRTVYATHSVRALLDTRKHIAGTLASLAGTWTAVMIVSAVVYHLLDRISVRLCAGEQGHAYVQSRGGAGSAGRRTFAALWALIFLCWIPAFLAYFPGITAYDTFSQSRQAMAGISGMSKYHPPLHTIFWMLCIKTGAKLGIDATLVYQPLQMIMLSFAFAVMLFYMIRRRFHPAVIALSLLYTVLNPIIAIFSLEMVKDSMFTVFLLLLTTQIARLSDCVCAADAGSEREKLFDADNTESPAFWLCLGLLTTIVCLLRNNAVYTVVLFVPAACVLARRYWRRVLITFASAIMLYALINGPVYRAMGISEGNSREMFSIPIQQITTVVVTRGDALSEADIEAINRFLPCEELPGDYNPRFADYAKNAFHTDYYANHRREFVKLWLGLFRRFPMEYWSAFLDLNIQLWYPGSAPVDLLSEREYVETFIFKSEYSSGKRTQWFPGLLKFYEEASKYSPWMGLPVLRAVFALWTPVWMLVSCFFILMARGRPEKTLILYIPFFLWLTYMAGPVSCTRYVFPIMAMYPLIVGVTLQSAAGGEAEQTTKR